MNALRTNLAILVLLVGLASGCTPDSGGNTILDGIFGFGDDGQQIDPVIEATAGATAVALGDIDNDGRMDFASISSENQPVQLHLLNGQGAFDLLSIAGGGPLAIMNDVETADFNLDGRLDIAVLVKDTGFVPPEDTDMPSAIILLIQGADALDPNDWIWVEPPPNPCYDACGLAGCDLFLCSNATGPTDLEVDDFNGDGLPDLAVTSNEPDPGGEEALPHTFVYVYPNPGIANVTNPAAWQRSIADYDVLDYSDLAVADIDSDGDPDIVAGVPEAKTWNLRWLRNAGNGADWDTVFLGQQMGGADHLEAGDINDDGSPDVAVASTTYSLIQWFRNPGPNARAPSAAQVPWYVYNIGLISDVTVDGQSQSIEFNQLQLLDTDGDAELEVFATGSGYAYEFQRTSNVFNPWTGEALFKADPTGELGWCAFYDYTGNGVRDIIVPVNRDGLTQDGFYLLVR